MEIAERKSLQRILSIEHTWKSKDVKAVAKILYPF